MEPISAILTDLAPYMPFICFGLLVLAGMNFPIPEDIVFLAAAAITITTMPEIIIYVYIACYTGALASDTAAYSIGRFGGRRLLNIPTIRKMLTGKKEKKIENYFERYGVKTLFFGRFIPFGVRNLIFMTAGFSRVSYPKFILVDMIPLAITSSLLFYLGITFGERYHELAPYLQQYERTIALIAAGTAALIILIKVNKKRNKKSFVSKTETKDTSLISR